jgi:hypothetical protein
MTEIVLGHRVLNTIDGRFGFVINVPYNKLIPVNIEGSTRKELWPASQVKLRNKKLQLKNFGGDFIPPKGFPLAI